MLENKLKVLSLFDGISGAQQALKNLGIECEYYASEVDRFAIQITQNNFPNTIQLGDVKKIQCLLGYNVESSYLHCEHTRSPQIVDGRIDLLCGGSPCQDLSIAKKDRKGLEGERSGLFYEYVRILKEVKPKFFILENVASMSKESKELISKELFNIEPILINSSLLVAQQRKRLYWVGKLQQDGTYKKVNIEQPQDKGILLKDILEIDVDEKYNVSQKHTEAMMRHNKNFKTRDLSGKTTALTASYYKLPLDGNYILVEPICVASRGRNIVDGKRQDIKGAKTEQRLWNNLEKKQRTMIAEPVLYNQYNQRTLKDKSGTLSTSSHSRTSIAGQIVIEPICVASRGRNIVDGKRQDIKEAKTEQRLEPNLNYKTNTLTSVQKDNLILQPIRIGHLNKGGQGDRIYSVQGKSINLSANGGGRGAKTGLYKIDLPDGEYIVRKLTTNECCRLQGFPDNYVSLISKTQGYKALGNSFTVPVIEHILKAILYETK